MNAKSKLKVFFKSSIPRLKPCRGNKQQNTRGIKSVEEWNIYEIKSKDSFCMTCHFVDEKVWNTFELDEMTNDL